MKITSWNLLFFVAVAMTADEVVGDSLCYDQGILPGNSGKHDMDADCNMTNWRIVTSSITEIPYMYLARGDIGEGNECRVHEGDDTFGPLLAVFTGDGSEVGAVRPNSGNQMFFDCDLANPHTPLLWSYQIILYDDCGGRFPSEGTHEISSPVDPDTGSNYPHCAFCVWEFDSNPECKHTFYLNTTIFSDNDFIFINFGPDNVGGFGNALRYGNATHLYFGPDNRIAMIGGSHFRVMFVSDGSGFTFGFRMTIETECPPPDPLTCGEVVEIFLNEDTLHKLNATTGDILYIAPSEDVKPEDVDPSCVTTISDPYFIFNVTQCVPVAEESDGVIKLTYIVWNQKYLDPSVPVQRYFIFCVNFTCEFESNYTLTSSELEPEIRKIGFDTDPVDAQFQVSLELYNNDTFEDPLADDATITVPQYVYAEVEMTDVPASADNFHVDMTSCWATLTDQPTVSPIYPIIQAGCPVVNPFDPSNAIIMLRNSQPIYGQFKFRSFVWTNVTDQEIYVHCDVTICDTEAGECPELCTEKRRRRSVAAVGEKRILSAGPILIAKKPDQKVIQGNEVDYDFIQSVRPIQESHEQEMIAFFVLVLVAAACAVILLLSKKL